MADGSIKIIPYHGFKELCQALDFYELSHGGGTGYIDGHDPRGKPVMVKHELEDDAGFNWRKNLATYINYCEPIVSAYNDHVFREEIKRSQDDDFREWSRDVDLRGLDLTSFMRDAAKMAQILTLCWIGVDTPDIPPGVRLSVREQKRLNLKPYLQAWDPRRVPDFAFDDIGLSRIVVLIDQTTKAGVAEKYERKMTFREWTRQTVRDYDVVTPPEVGSEQPVIDLEVTLVNERANEYGRVPFEPLYFRRLADGRGESQIKAISLLNLKIFRYLSLYDEEIHRNTYTRLYATGEGLNADNIDVGSSQRGNTVVCIDGQDVKLIPHSADPAQAQNILAGIERFVREIYRLSGRPGGNPYDGRQAESGISKQEDKDDEYRICAQIAANCQRAENRVLELAALAAGKQEDAWSGSQYPNRFDLRSLQEELDLSIDMDGVPFMSVRARAEQSKKIAEKLLPGNEKLQEILEEIDRAAEQGIVMRFFIDDKKGPTAMTIPLEGDLPTAEEVAAAAAPPPVETPAAKENQPDGERAAEG